jgi:hypothetical protein
LNTGYYGIPVATFGLVTIATAIFVHVTFEDELRRMGTQIYDATQNGVKQASNWVETAQDQVSDQLNRAGEAISEAVAPPPQAPIKKESSEDTPNESPSKEVEEVEEDVAYDRRAGGKNRKSIRKRYRK